MANDRPGSRMDPERERGLIARARTDSAAFGELFDYHLPRVYGFVARRVGDRAAVEQITASTLQRGLEAIQAGTLKDGSSFGGWLCRIAASAIVDQAARAQRDLPEGVRAGDMAEPDADRATGLVGDEVATAAFAAALDRAELRRGFGRITEPQRRVLVLKYFDGLSAGELCAALGVSATTLESRLQRALRALDQASTGRGSNAA
jgi:RNA polymerase sigma-70 factor (ECF subfamily)